MTAAPPRPAPVATGDVDAAGVRRVWDQILDAVARRKRTTRALLETAHVTGVQGRELQLTFQTTPLARQFDKAPNPEVVHDALAEVLGVDWVVKVTFGDGEPAPAAAAPPDDEFDPRDEPADPPAPAPGNGEDPAMALLRSGLGAQVISRTEPG